MGNIKQINIKNRTYYFFDDMINIKYFDSNLLKAHTKPYKNIGHITIKCTGDYESIHTVNPLYFIIGEVDGYIEEKNGNKYLIFVSTDKNKVVLRKHTELWDKIKSLIKKISDKLGFFDEKYINVKFNLNDNLPLNKILKLHNLTIVVRSVFQEDNKHYP